MTSTTPTARIHRFNDTVALSIGDGLTQYLTPAMAQDLARTLTAYATDVEFCAFTDSTLAGHGIESRDSVALGATQAECLIDALDAWHVSRSEESRFRFHDDAPDWRGAVRGTAALRVTDDRENGAKGALDAKAIRAGLRVLARDNRPALVLLTRPMGDDLDPAMGAVELFLSAALIPE